MDALLSGTLMLEPDGCVVVRNGAVAAAVIWPHGFSGNRTADWTLEVLNPKGKVVARIGQHVSYGGGFDVGRPPEDPPHSGSAVAGRILFAMA